MNKTLIVVDDVSWLGSIEGAEVVSFNQYLSDFPKQNEPQTRIINLCDTEQYLSKGYYCSLLAEARKHRVLPSIRVSNDARELKAGASAVSLGLSQNLPILESDQGLLELVVCFGQTEQSEWNHFCQQIFKQYPLPLMRLQVENSVIGYSVKLERIGLNQLKPCELSIAREQLEHYIGSAWRHLSGKKRLRWEMAILVNEQEKHPPSDSAALKRFIKAAEKHNISARLIQPCDADQISQFDALFIRETTAIDHHTYRLAAKAEREGLVVIDDANSILRCCNKAYLHDAFSYHQVPAPRTRTISDAEPDTLTSLEDDFGYPMVLKMPEGSFSIGVYKVATRAELIELLERLFNDSALVLVQEYLFTEFDWRIGVMNGRALYACKYLMARGHWQIYNHNAKKSQISGGFETLPTFEVPKRVLSAAIKAANMVGKGLYGVDIKQQGDKVYVIEVNDNPSIEYKVEDAYLGDELYMQIMAEFALRLEQRGK